MCDIIGGSGEFWEDDKVIICGIVRKYDLKFIDKWDFYKFLSLLIESKYIDKPYNYDYLQQFKAYPSSFLNMWDTVNSCVDFKFYGFSKSENPLGSNLVDKYKYKIKWDVLENDLGDVFRASRARSWGNNT